MVVNIYDVTVGVPTRNNIETIVKCINSILSQSTQRIKIVVSDNASSDGSGALLKRMFSGNCNVKILEQESNVGAATNFAKLIQQCDTEFFMWLGGDDYISEDFIDVNLKFLNANPDYIASSSFPIFLKEDHEIPGVSIDLEGNLKSRLVNFFRYANRSHNVFYSLLRTEEVKRYPYFGSEFAAADWAFDLYLISKGKIRTNGPGNVFFGTNGVSRNQNANRQYKTSLAGKFLPLLPFSRRALRIFLRKPHVYLILFSFICRINWTQFKVDCIWVKRRLFSNEIWK